MTDPYDLDRFLKAQARDYEWAITEIRNGLKRSHWMWYVFPQLAGLGMSPTSVRYSIKSRDEASAYLNHPILGPRLIECCEAALAVEGKSAHDIFGSPDDLKLRSCATLFAEVAPSQSVFDRVLHRYFRGERDEKTIGLIYAH